MTKWVRYLVDEPGENTPKKGDIVHVSGGKLYAEAIAEKMFESIPITENELEKIFGEAAIKLAIIRKDVWLSKMGDKKEPATIPEPRGQSDLSEPPTAPMTKEAWGEVADKLAGTTTEPTKEISTGIKGCFTIAPGFTMKIEPLPKGEYKGVILNAGWNPIYTINLGINFDLKWDHSYPIVNGIAGATGLPKDEIKKALRAISNELALKGRGILGSYVKKEEDAPPLVEFKPSEESKAKALEVLTKQNPIEYIADIIQKVHSGDKEKSKYLLASEITVKLGHKNHTLVVGQPGSGKSDLVRKTTRCVPPNKRIKLDSFSPKSIYYAKKAGISTQGSVIYVDDVDPEDEEQVKTLKMMASDDPEAMRHWAVGDNKDFQEFVVNRDYVILATTITALNDKQAQFLRRYDIVNPDESAEGLNAAMGMIKEDMRNGKSEQSYPPEFEVCQVIMDEINNQNLTPLIPFDFTFPVQGLESKTAIKKFSSLVWATAKAHFKQRIIEGEYLLVQPEDFEYAANLWKCRQPLKIDKTAMRILLALGPNEPVKERHEEGKTSYEAWIPEPTTKTTLSRTLKIAPRTVNDKLAFLYDAGYADRKPVGGKGSPYAYWLAEGVQEKLLAMGKTSEDIGRWLASPDITPRLEPLEVENSIKHFYEENEKLKNTHTHQPYLERVCVWLANSGNKKEKEQSNQTPPNDKNRDEISGETPTAREEEL